MKASTSVAAVIAILIGLFLAYCASAIFSLIIAFILGFLLGPFLEIVNVPFFTERLSNLGFGQLFVLVFTFRLIVGVVIPIKANTERKENT
jgi:hypothetical protein